MLLLWLWLWLLAGLVLLVMGAEWLVIWSRSRHRSEPHSDQIP